MRLIEFEPWIFSQIKAFFPVIKNQIKKKEKMSNNYFAVRFIFLFFAP